MFVSTVMVNYSGSLKFLLSSTFLINVIPIGSLLIVENNQSLTGRAVVFKLRYSFKRSEYLQICSFCLYSCTLPHLGNPGKLRTSGCQQEYVIQLS